MNVNDCKPDSRGCRYCQGAGIVTVYHEHYQGSATVVLESTNPRTGEVMPIKAAGTVGAYCVCPLGMWMHSRCKDEDKPRLVQVLDVLAGRTRYVMERPDLDEIDTGDLDRFWQRFRQRWQVGQPV